jgi:precorrin-6B C5,15-methyltransferase / cobalt-precorrin-6B C5,C15-methyltransferase
VSAPPLVVVGIGADGWVGLGEAARAAVLAAEVIVGSKRHLALVPETTAVRRPWPSPIDSLLDELTTVPGQGTCVLASGDPMLHGVGATLARRLGPEQLLIYPHPSALAFACARLGWPEADVELVSAVGRPPELLVRALQPGRRVIAYASGTSGASSLAAVLCAHGFGPSRMVVMEQLGGPAERLVESTAEGWGERPADALHTVAFECRPRKGVAWQPRTPGLPDDAYEHDGQITKRAVRAMALAALAPAPGQLLWDVGAGSGSIGIEWLRSEPTARAIAIEARADRAQRARHNARALGVPQLDVREGPAPAVLDGLNRPDAIFVGGGLTEPGLLEACWDALRPGGRLVANAVTLESEQLLVAACAKYAGELVRLEVSHAEPLGGFSAWRPHLPIVQWYATRGHA